MNKIVTKNKQFNCSECKNLLTVDENLKLGDYFECEFCGIEYEVIENQGAEVIVKVVEEEK